MSNLANEHYLAQNKGPWLQGIFWSFLGLSIFIVGLRFYCRQRYINTFQCSDYLMAVSMIMTCAMSSMIYMQIQTGMGRHIEYSQAHPGMLKDSMKFGYAENVLYQATVGVVKSSILAQYYHISASRYQCRIIISVWVFAAIFCVFATLSAIFQCIPVSAIFNPETFPKGCWNMSQMNLITSSINITVDCVIFILPLPVLVKLQLQRRKKTILFATYFFGSLSIVASALRISSMVLWTGQTDYTYVSAIIPIYDAVEINTGIVCACIPLLRPLVKTVVERHTNGFSSQSRQFAGWSTKNDVDEMPLRLLTPKDLEQIHERMSWVAIKQGRLPRPQCLAV